MARLTKAQKEQQEYERKRAYMEKIKGMNGSELLDEYTYLAGGDSYDGCYTEEGKWQWQQVDKEMRERLTKLGFFL
jgi:hypothetical protein